MSSKKWEAPTLVWVRAIFQWFYVGVVALVLWALTYFPMGPLMILTSKKGKNVFGEEYAKHDQKYIDQGASGEWYYIGNWIPILQWFSCYEDSLTGEPSGKHSARVKGKENTFWNKYLWTIRNPFNYLKRTTRFFACYVNESVVKYWGDRELSDKNMEQDGSYLVMAVDQGTKKTYYGYRKVVYFDKLGWYLKLKEIFKETSSLKKYSHLLENKVFQATFGYKIKPTHDTEIQAWDDRDKAFTFRVQIWANIN